MIQVYQNAASIQDVISVFINLLENLPHQYELEAAIGHFYYLSQQFLKAQECYE